MQYSFAKSQLLSRWVPSSKGESLLHLVADSSCEKKGNLLLERIMGARWPCWANSFQKHVSRHKLSQTLRSTVRTCKPSLEAYKELSSQEMELTRMYEELEQNRSLLQLLLQNCPDSVHRLLDRFRLKFWTRISHFLSVASWRRRTMLSTLISSCFTSKTMTTVS